MRNELQAGRFLPLVEKRGGCVDGIGTRTSFDIYVGFTRKFGQVNGRYAVMGVLESFHPWIKNTKSKI